MLFFLSFRMQRCLQRALRAAVAMHRAEALRHLLATHGARAFAKALSAQSPRVMADALSLLPATDRIRVRVRMPHAAQRRLHAADGTATASGWLQLALAWCPATRGLHRS
ncbi:hypothetical protein [Xanthomonas maliensis]|uniref:hypothetical protein n=1 Tax=Xanthomonas maliensis TaxID=1321368 RepID=UPI0003A9C205|nr:hypothetical protein [Xanthomonas maliensis]